MRDLLDAPGRCAEQERLALTRLEHHLLVELADAALPRLRADQEHAVQPAVRDGAAAGERDAARALARAQSVRRRGPTPRAAAARRTRRTGSVRRACRGRLRGSAARDRRTARRAARRARDRRRSTARPRPSRRSAARARRADCAGSAICSTAPACMRSVSAAQARRSPRNFGMITPLLGTSMRWPARPMRCMPLATDGGDSTWMTRSIAPMSMPSSSDDVATSARSRPAFRSSSIRSRCSRAIEPWCACTSSSPASSFTAFAMRSARRRLLTKMSVERCSRISSRRRGWIAGQMLDRASARDAGPLRISSVSVPSFAMSSTGTSTRSSSCLLWPASTIFTGRGPSALKPPRNRATSSSGRCVAESPMRCSGLPGELLEPLERQREMRAALGRDHRVDLVDDHGLDVAQAFARRARQHEVQRLGRGDEDVRRRLREARALPRRRVAGADRDAGLAERRP